MPLVLFAQRLPSVRDLLLSESNVARSSPPPNVLELLADADTAGAAMHDVVMALVPTFSRDSVEESRAAFEKPFVERRPEDEVVRDRVLFRLHFEESEIRICSQFSLARRAANRHWRSLY